MRYDHAEDRARLKPGKKVRLNRHATDWSDDPAFSSLRKDDLKRSARQFLERNTKELYDAQELLWAADTHAVLVILQAMDAAGKDGVIKHVMSGLNPQGCRVYAFKRPSPEELDHTFLWRSMKVLPERGSIVIFNRSHYEDVLVVKVHPELLKLAKLPPGPRGDRFWKDRYDDINSLEHHLTRNGTLVLKFFLNVSKKEQKKRFLERLDEPDKNWKFSMGDLAERARWDDYQRAYEEMLSRTTTPWAPWYVVPADNKWVARAIVAAVLTKQIRALSLSYPQLSGAQIKELREARRRLMKE